MSEDALQYLPLERWRELQKVFKKDWPRGISGYTVLETQREFINQGFGYGFKVYCPFGDVWNGMVAINEKNKFYEIIIQCPRDACLNLEDALKKTKIINWEKSIIIPFAQYYVIESMQKSLKHCEIDLLPSESFIKDDNIKFEDVSLPPGITFGHLSLEHVDLLDSTWPHRYDSSKWYFELLINAKYGYGLFEDDRLVAWVLLNEAGPLLHLYTIDTHRKKGLGELILKLVSNILMEQSKPVIAYCLKDNVKACNLYKKVRFVQSDPIAWCYLKKKLNHSLSFES